MFRVNICAKTFSRSNIFNELRTVVNHVTNYRHTANHRIITQIEFTLKYGHADFSIKSTKFMF